MKIFLLLICCMALTVSFAQPKAVPIKNLSEPEIIQLLNKYSVESTQENRAKISEKTQSIISSILPKEPKPGIILMMHTLVNASGAVDHILVDLAKTQGYNLDSLARVLTDGLARGFTDWKIDKKIEGAFTYTSYHLFGKAPFVREVRRGDSTIVDLKSAMSFADTLKIKRLYLNQLGLKSIPDVIYRFPNIKELYLGGNEIHAANIDMNRLPKLEQLHIQQNQLTNDSFTISKNKTLQILNARENKFSTVPDAARSCKKMSSLWLGGNELRALNNRSFRKLRQVKDLNFYKSNIAVLPPGIRKLKNLEVLDLYYNTLTSLPTSVTRLKRLTQLAVSHNELKALPDKISRLKKLHTLFAHHNNLSKLPVGIRKLEQMRILDLGYNWYTDFPTEIVSFKNLEELDLSSNNFLEFPQQLLEIKRLDKLYLRGNPFIETRKELKYASQLDILKGKNIEVFY